MILTQIQAKDFLSIKGSMAIDMDKKITILLGSNDHGKSNILRAIQHLNEDDPILETEANWDAEDAEQWENWGQTGRTPFFLSQSGIADLEIASPFSARIPIST